MRLFATRCDFTTEAGQLGTVGSALAPNSTAALQALIGSIHEKHPSADGFWGLSVHAIPTADVREAAGTDRLVGLLREVLAFHDDIKVTPLPADLLSDISDTIKGYE